MKRRESGPPPLAAQPGRTARSVASGAEQDKVICPNCGAEISGNSPRCPYCSAVNPGGAEKAYLDELEDLKNDTEKLAADTEEDLSSNLQRSTRWVIALIVAVVALIAFAFLAFSCAKNADERQELQNYQARESFRERHFAELDRLFEEGDDEALVAYAWTLMDESGYEALFSWKHSAYLQTCEDWYSFSEARSSMQDGSADMGDYVWAVSAALRLARIDAGGKLYAESLAREEEERLSGYRAEARQFLDETLNLSGTELEEFAASVEDPYGYVQADKLEEALEARFGQLDAAR